MQTTNTTIAVAARREIMITYEPATSRAALLEEALRCTITGRPIPTALRPSSAVTNPAVTTFAELFAR